MSEAATSSAGASASGPRPFDARGQRALLGAMCLMLAGGAAALYFLYPVASGYFPPCVFHMLTGLDCPGCGSTRACAALVHGHLWQAVRYNVLLLVAGPYLVYLFGRFAWAAIRGQPHREPVYRTGVILAIVVVVIAYGVARNVPGPTREWLGAGAGGSVRGR